jgi:hypothetical protein
MVNIWYVVNMHGGTVMSRFEDFQAKAKIDHN